MPLSWGEAYIMQRGRRINDCTRYHETSVKNVASAHLPIRFMVCTHAFHCFTMLRYYADDRTREIEEVYYLKKKNGQDGVSDTWKEASFLIRPRMHESGCDRFLGWAGESNLRYIRMYEVHTPFPLKLFYSWKLFCSSMMSIYWAIIFMVCLVTGTIFITVWVWGIES